MKRISLFLLLVLLCSITVAQEIKGRSQQGYVSIAKDPPKPPYLDIEKSSLTFTDTDGNRYINANEKTIISFKLTNTGMGKGLNLKAVTKETTGAVALTFKKETYLGTLDPGKNMLVEIPVTAGMNTQTGMAGFAIAIKEANGFGTDPVLIEVPTKAFIAPQVSVVDYKITSQLGTTIQKRKPFQVQVLIQNLGQGLAENINVSFSVPQNMYCLSSNESTTIQSLEPGASQLIEYSLVANNNYTLNDIKLNIKVTEKYRKYGESKLITIAMNQQVSANKLTVTGIAAQQKAITRVSLTSAVDKNIPFNSKKYPNRVALVIGNEDYSGSLNAEVNVEFARNDARVFQQYLLNTLGVEKQNLYLVTDASVGEMKRNIDLVTRLVQKMGPEAELIFYYAGHGFPDEIDKTPYLIPVDVNATNLTDAIKLADVYEKFGNTGAARVTVFLDACFSGGGRNKGLLAARGVKIKPKKAPLANNMVVFAASSGEQSALSYNKEKHGMFTYFLLKKLQATQGSLTYRELGNYIKTNVAIESLRVNGKDQEPEVWAGDREGTVLDQWRIVNK